MHDRSPTIENPWQHLRQLTPARIALGRAGISLPTDAQLDFQFAHAQARDAVHLPLDCAALAVQRHSAPMALKITEHCQAEGWSLGPITLVEQGRVAIADEIGQRLKARMVVILLGERPGLSSPDSLGL